MKLLFVCTENRLRSPTAETVFAQMPGIEALSCGTNRDAETPLTGDLVQWADVILVMEKFHRQKVAQRFPELLKEKRLVCLDIPDHYDYLQPELIALLQRRVAKVLNLN